MFRVYYLSYRQQAMTVFLRAGKDWQAPGHCAVDNVYVAGAVDSDNAPLVDNCSMGARTELAE